MLTIRLRWIVAAVLVLGILGQTLRTFYKHQKQDAAREMAPVLREGEREKIIIDLRAGTVTAVRKRRLLHRGTQAGEDVALDRRDLQGARKATVTVKEDGSVKVWVQNKGLSFEPGISAAYTDRPKLGLDVQLGYYKKWGWSVGVVSDDVWRVDLYTAANYQLYRNTQLFVGVTQRGQFATGVSIRF